MQWIQNILVLLFYLVWLAGAAALLHLGLRLIPRARMQVAVHKATAVEDTARFIRDQEHELWPDKKLGHLHRSIPICGPGPLMQGKVPSAYTHPMLIKMQERYFDGYETSVRDKYAPTTPDLAQYVGSLIIDDPNHPIHHTVMLDLDYPVTLVESTSTGHYHLYIDKPVPWPQYKRLLTALWKAGLIETGYYKQARELGQTFLRPPWVKKMPSKGR